FDNVIFCSVVNRNAVDVETDNVSCGCRVAANRVEVAARNFDAKKEVARGSWWRKVGVEAHRASTRSIGAYKVALDQVARCGGCQASDDVNTIHGVARYYVPRGWCGAANYVARCIRNVNAVVLVWPLLGRARRVQT